MNKTFGDVKVYLENIEDNFKNKSTAFNYDWKQYFISSLKQKINYRVSTVHKIKTVKNLIDDLVYFNPKLIINNNSILSSPGFDYRSWTHITKENEREHIKEFLEQILDTLEYKIEYQNKLENPYLNILDSSEHQKPSSSRRGNPNWQNPDKKTTEIILQAAKEAYKEDPQAFKSQSPNNTASSWAKTRVLELISDIDPDVVTSESTISRRIKENWDKITQ